MAAIQNILKRSSLFVTALALLAAWVMGDVVLFAQHAGAAQLIDRSLAVSSSANGTISTATPGDGGNGLRAKHTVTFTMGTSGATMGSIALIYCTTPLPQTTCTSGAATTGNASNLTSAAVSGTGVGGSGWALDTATSNPTVTNYGTCNGGGTVRQNCVLLKPSSATANTGAASVTVTYGGGASDYVTNPTDDNTTFFVRIVVFSDANYSTVVDNGTVANSTADQINITAKVQETLNFSVGSTFVANSGSCESLTNGELLLGSSPDGVLDFSQAYDARSYFRVSTNANNGTVIYYSGDTLKYGASDIASVGLGSTGADGGAQSNIGSEQFGLAIDAAHANSTLSQLAPNDGTNIAGHLYDYGDGTGTITDGGTSRFHYDTASATTPRPIAIADNSTITCDTGVVRYLGNISTTTPPGVYTTTITYLALPTY